jgi:hypothetical protein
MLSVSAAGSVLIDINVKSAIAAMAHALCISRGRFFIASTILLKPISATSAQSIPQ